MTDIRFVPQKEFVQNYINLLRGAGVRKPAQHAKRALRCMFRPVRQRTIPARVPLDTHVSSPVQRMTNWQRNQWAKAGYPQNRIDEFAGMIRPYRVVKAIAMLEALT